MEFNEGLKWIVGTVVALLVSLLSLLGLGKIREMKLANRISEENRQREQHETNAGKQIEADAAMLQRLFARVDKLEAEQKEMNKNLLSQAISNAKLETENVNLKTENLRKDKEISELNKKSGVQEREILDLREELRKMELKVLELTSKIERFSEGKRNE